MAKYRRNPGPRPGGREDPTPLGSEKRVHARGQNVPVGQTIAGRQAYNQKYKTAGHYTKAGSRGTASNSANNRSDQGNKNTFDIQKAAKRRLLHR